MGLTPASIEAVIGAGVRDLVRLSGGASRETWSFSAGGRRLIVRRDPPGRHDQSGVGMSVEARLLRAAAQAGVPVPAVVASGDDLEGAAFIIVEHVDGETIPRRVLRNVAASGMGGALIEQCAQALARIHAMTPPEGVCTFDEVAWVRDVLDRSSSAHPAFELAYRWLVERRVPPVPPKLVHGDFRIGNLIVGADGLRSVLDWELAHLGDPLEDLGWMCVKSWRFGSPLHAGGLGSAEDLVAAYERASGASVDWEALKWWEVMGTVRWGMICLLQVASHLSGRTRSVELAAIGRRVCEVEHDVLELIA